MSKMDEKIAEFARDIMAEVQEKKAKILSEFEKENALVYEKKEEEYLAQAYEIIQEGMRKVEREINELQSKKKMENRGKLLHKRTEIIDSVFRGAEKELAAFAASDAYKEYLMGMLDRNLAATGKEQVTVYLSAQDAVLAEEIKDKYKVLVTVEDRNANMIGGCKIYDAARNIFIDDSFAKRLESQRDEFMKNCDLSIE
ncbi:V-type ATP synthase subunit E [Anaerotalea alkaliphila]|uniref:V/A-type H+-transporting ATPase subunit E n=1 Tax=Anaerotalea alkaliphila TaxID=2662126 RepID=A0A7X5HTU6_9FIRM|nr:V-type ATP synthase subunit E [Anaerotalea alkaliphila]NDL66538.1 hypothetical protein [Anaerotalea alkaliphila]